MPPIYIPINVDWCCDLWPYLYVIYYWNPYTVVQFIEIGPNKKPYLFIYHHIKIKIKQGL